MAVDNSLNFFDDALLVSEAKNTDRIGLFRKDSSGNNEKTVTVADLIASINPDYTSLTEQAVPGEFWLDADGTTKRQVYVRTFTGTAPSDGTNIVLTQGVYRAWMVSGYMTSELGEHQPPYIISGAAGDQPTYLYYYAFGVGPVSGGGKLVVHDIGSRLKGNPYSFTFFYTKA